jgi:sortase A
VFLILFGSGLSLYVLSPLILWEIFLAPKISTQPLITPIPQHEFLSQAKLSDFFSPQAHGVGSDLSKASNWYPGFENNASKSGIFTLDIPKLHITQAEVSTIDDDLTKHLVNYAGTCTPPDKGNCVIFGHSTLPQLYNPHDYKTIFANILSLDVNDTIIVHKGNITYTYTIFSITVVEPDDTSVLAQTTDDSYLTIITCTPPGTIWKRLVIKSRLTKL